MAKTPSKKSAKAPKKATTGTKRSKKRVESYSSYIYKVSEDHRPQTDADVGETELGVEGRVGLGMDADCVLGTDR